MNNELFLDTSIQTPQERIERVNQIIANTPPENLTPYYLSKMADYIVIPINKKERKQRFIITSNRESVFQKRETSFDKLVTQFELGESAIHSFITNDKNIIFSPKTSITPKDIKNIPDLAALVKAIEQVKKECDAATGRRKYLLKEQLKQMYKDQYVIKYDYYKPIHFSKTVQQAVNIEFPAESHPEDTTSANLFNPNFISLLLRNYSKLKEDSFDKFNSDIYYIMQDLDNLIDAALADNAIFKKILIYKIDGLSNADIYDLISQEFDYCYSLEYLSIVWRQKIPKLLAEFAINKYLEWYYTYKDNSIPFKKCSCCGKKKLAHSRFFSPNKNGKDGFYSICKECRRKKNGGRR